MSADAYLNTYLIKRGAKSGNLEARRLFCRHEASVSRSSLLHIQVFTPPFL